MIEESPRIGLSKLLHTRQVTPALTAYAEVDSRKALLRGLQEYFAQVAFREYNGTTRKFASVTVDVADKDFSSMEASWYPALGVTTVDGRSDYESTSSAEQFELDFLDGNSTVMGGSSSDMSAFIELTILALNTPDLDAYTRFVESALQPELDAVDLRVVLPFYHNAVARYSMVDVQSNTTSAAVHAGKHTNTITVQGIVPKINVYGEPGGMTIVIQVEVV